MSYEGPSIGERPRVAYFCMEFGLDENAASSLVITLPARGMTLILMANSDRLVRPLPLAAGDLMVSPFARLFLSLFAR